jgi:tetratricopeptide (TPR) repeat protein
VEILHSAGHLIPHLTLNDVMVLRTEDGRFQIKIDYKLSRFLNPKLDRPPPMLRHLLSCHPDIVNRRPLDTRSDIWSLGKIFVEILTGEFEIDDPAARVEQLAVPHEVRVLLRTMLAEDPDLRPRNAGDVAAALKGIGDGQIREAQRRGLEMAGPGPRPGRPWAGIGWTGTAVGLLAVLLLAVGLALIVRRSGPPDISEEYASRYAPSIAFVLVHYRIKDGNQTAYENRSEGTAFLADRNGHLLTSRHVACPWLEDGAFQAVARHLKEAGRSPELEYRVYLWFEGSRAFNRSAGFIESPDLADLYFLESAFRSQGTPGVEIAGVARHPTATRQLISSPLKDDFAVLRVFPIPEGLRPLPLAQGLDARTIPRLSRIITLGFPLGSRTQAADVSVSVTRGSVRRSFEDAIQIDASLYGGNSGGPVIDGRGTVIGIASGVATERAQGLLPTVTPLWHLAMVLPITKAAAFLEELRAGQVKWNGIQDFALEARLKRIRGEARQGRWAEAARVADAERERSSDPSVVLAAAMMRWCAGDEEAARRLFGQAVSMDPEGGLAKFMCLVIDWWRDRLAANPYRRELNAADWGSPLEFLGYLTRVLEGGVSREAALGAWDTPAEKSWIHWACAMRIQKAGDPAGAEGLLREAVLVAPADSWEGFLSAASLEGLQRQLLEAAADALAWGRYRSELDAFRERLREVRQEQEGRKTKLEAVLAPLQKDSISLDERVKALAQAAQIEPENGRILEELAFLRAAQGAWEPALDSTRAFLQREGRENARRLTLGILEGVLLSALGRGEEARACMEAFAARTRDPWHRAVAEALLGKRGSEALVKEAAGSPEKLLTLHLALGAWAEGRAERRRALEEYREVLASLLDTWVQFDFARERFEALRRAAE